ncbi:MAG TPA: acyltransferase [Acetobacteraceae bacterium]|nr:acyltransferase [Acetobacteraceae bacterium]
MRRSEQLLCIQYLRAIATLTVVAAHSTTRLFEFGEAAVSLFFVISGFVMVYVSQRGTRPLAFLRARFIRVVPLYWIVTLFVAIAYGASEDHLVQSLLFWPHPGPGGRGWPVIGQGWTLVFEVFFYLIFAATLLGSAKARPWIIASIFAVLCGAGYLLQPTDFVLATYTSPLLLEFAAGALLYEAWRRPLMPTSLPAACMLGIGVLILALQAGFGSPEHRWLAWGVTSVFVLAGALGMERAGWMPRFAPLKLLGDASYSIYLVQFFVVNPIHRRLGDWPELVSVPLTLIGSAALGLAVYALLERPLQRLRWTWAKLPKPGLSG